MTVAELRAILDHVPDDLEVHVTSGYAKSCHLQRVIRRGPFTIPDLDMPGSRYRAGEKAPSALVLDGRVGWWWTPPPFEIQGPIRRRAELDEKLNALDPYPVPT